jgi:hypothetical protein
VVSVERMVFALGVAGSFKATLTAFEVAGIIRRGRRSV